MGLEKILRTYGPKGNESSPRLAARDGMEQEPYESRAAPGSKGKATHGAFRKYAFLASQKTSFERGRSLRMARGLLSAAGLRHHSQPHHTPPPTTQPSPEPPNPPTRPTRNRS